MTVETLDVLIKELITEGRCMPYCLALGAGYIFLPYHKNWRKIGTEVKFGATVVHTICSG